MNLPRISLLFLLLAAGLPTAWAAPADHWERLSVLRAGERIAVRQTDGDERKGEFIRYSADSLALRTNGSEVRIERTRVSKVVALSRSNRWRNVLIGVGIGAAVGLVVDRTVGAYLNNEAEYNAGGRALAFGVPIGLFGGLGASFAGHPTVYKVPRR